MTEADLEVVSVAEIFGGVRRFRVPMYQRAYAWGKDEIDALLDDVQDYQSQGAPAYYIGSLVVSASTPVDPDSFDVVDGQQRLTTLFLILTALLQESEAGPLSRLRSEQLREKLLFEGRKRSTEDLRLLARNPSTPAEILQEQGIAAGVEHVRAGLARIKSEGNYARFASYLLESVRVVFSVLPPTTDLNHYFEVMNSRGEQLEKHEIVKARLLGRLGSDPVARRTFSRIWDACSDLTEPRGTKFVQARFSPAERTALFGDEWDALSDFDVEPSAIEPVGDGRETLGTSYLARCFDGVTLALSGVSTSNEESRGGRHVERTIASMLTTPPPLTSESSSDKTDSTARYGSIIDLPNFLLHVLRLHQQSDSIPLDDKRLVAQFEAAILTDTDAKGFAFALLKARFLFDNFVLKTEHDRETRDDDSNWVLYRPHKVASGGLSPRATFPEAGADEDVAAREGRRVLALQSMLQVSFSGRSNKEFLYRTLEFLFRRPDLPTAAEYVGALERIVRDRYAVALTRSDLDSGTNVPHFIFNFLDYALWLEYQQGWRAELGPMPAAISSYRFRYRHSVEHFYPVQPRERRPLLPEEYNAFGNLCLLTPSENSQRSNLDPISKVAEYRSTMPNQSLKFQLMAAITDDKRDWSYADIEEHGQHMRQLLERIGSATGDGWAP